MIALDAVLLAAGSSSRLGRPKQLLMHEGSSLLVRALSALAGGAEPRRLVVVLGAHASRLRALLAQVPVPCEVIENLGWAAGIGSSLRTGLAHLQGPPAAGVLVGVCDQPDVGADHFARMRAAFSRSPTRLVASGYAGARGVPALFPARLLPELIALPAAQGAKSLIERHAASGIEIPCPGAALDIDTEADYQRLLGTTPA
jgi:molybdenum cofactor cytidylyltransferase